MLSGDCTCDVATRVPAHTVCDHKQLHTGIAAVLIAFANLAVVTAGCAD